MNAESAFNGAMHDAIEHRPRPSYWVRWAGAALWGVCLSACAPMDAAPQAGLPAAGAVPCAPDDFQRAVESGPLYAAAERGSGVESCTVRYTASSIEMRYRFRNGGWLRSRRDAALESTELQAGLAAPLAEEPMLVLARAERWAFGEEGCGIDWQRREAWPAAAGATDTVSHGEVCHCQARIRRDSGGRVTELVLSSAC